jgi:hypothetical protein
VGTHKTYVTLEQNGEKILICHNMQASVGILYGQNVKPAIIYSSSRLFYFNIETYVSEFKCFIYRTSINIFLILILNYAELV